MIFASHIDFQEAGLLAELGCERFSGASVQVGDDSATAVGDHHLDRGSAKAGTAARDDEGAVRDIHSPTPVGRYRSGKYKVGGKPRGERQPQQPTATANAETQRKHQRTQRRQKTGRRSMLQFAPENDHRSALQTGGMERMVRTTICYSSS